MFGGVCLLRLISLGLLVSWSLFSLGVGLSLGAVGAGVGLGLGGLVVGLGLGLGLGVVPQPHPYPTRHTLTRTLAFTHFIPHPHPRPHTLSTPHPVTLTLNSYALPRRQAKMKHAIRFWRNHAIVKMWPQWRDTAKAHKVRRLKLADMTLLLFPLNMWDSFRHQASVQTAERAADDFFKQFVKRSIFPALRQATYPPNP